MWYYMFHVVFLFNGPICEAHQPVSIWFLVNIYKSVNPRECTFFFEGLYRATMFTKTLLEGTVSTLSKYL